MLESQDCGGRITGLWLENHRIVAGESQDCGGRITGLWLKNHRIVAGESQDCGWRILAQRGIFIRISIAITYILYINL